MAERKWVKTYKKFVPILNEMSIKIVAILITTSVIVDSLSFVEDYRKNESLQLLLSDGWIQGELQLTRDTYILYYSYEGIPYAKPPVGPLRFQPPQPPDKWSGILDANGNVPICVQIPPKPDLEESEDCLYINVYTPFITPSVDRKLLPVMVWIHGGGFMFGQAKRSYYMPDYLLAKQVVVVHFNYRLNVFGFLSTGDLASPGNYGLKDQQFALDWIRRNIARFGGDPAKVTIFGESAGSVSVQLQLLSLMNRDRIHAAISQSGSCLCQWALQTRPKKIAYEIAAVLGILPRDTYDLIEQLRNVPMKVLKDAAIKITIVNSIDVANGLPFGPTIELPHPSAFLTQLPYNLLENGRFLQVPHIIGFNSQESAVAQPGLELIEPLLKLIDTDPRILVPSSLNITDNDRRRTIGRMVKEFYFGNNKTKPQQYVEYISDVYFYRPILKSAKFFAKFTPTYLYRFSYEGYYLGRKSFNFQQNENINGTMHTEEIWYLFGRDDLKQTNQTDFLVRDKMVEIWTNFAKLQKPTIKWPFINYTDSNIVYLDINQQLTLNCNNHRHDAMLFWDKIYRNYGQSPFITY